MPAETASPASRIVERIWRERFLILICFAAFLGFALTLARQAAHGVGLQHDSVNYIIVARNLLAGEGFTELYGRPYTFWAPLYPMALAGTGLFGADPQDAAGPLSAALFGLTVAAAGIWLKNRLTSRLLAAWGILAIACSLPLLWAASYALATPMLILFTTLALISADGYLRNGKFATLAQAALWSGLAAISHYMGVSVIVCITLFLIFQRNAAPLGRAARIAAYSAIACLPIGLWMGYNFLRIGDATGSKFPVDYSLLGLASDIVEFITGWVFINLFVESRYGGFVQWPVAVVAIGVCLFAATIAFTLNLFKAAQNPAGWAERRPFRLFASFSVIYAGLYLFATMQGYNTNGVQERQIMPLYLPLFIAMIIALDRLLPRMINQRLARRASAVFLGASLCCWLALAAALQPLAVREANAYGIGDHGRAKIRNSELILQFQRRARGEDVHTNNPFDVYAVTKGLPLPYRAPVEWEQFEQWIPTIPDGDFIAWFHGRRGDYTAADIRGRQGVEIVVEARDGTLFRVNKAYDPRLVYNAAYESVSANQPVVRSIFDVHLDGRTLSYAKSPCDREATESRFFLHVIPIAVNDLTDNRERWGFDNLDFSFEYSGARFNGICLISVALPGYPIAEITTGQFDGEERLWEERFPFP